MVADARVQALEAEALRMEEEHKSMEKQVEALNAELHQLSEDGKQKDGMNAKVRASIRMRLCV